MRPFVKFLPLIAAVGGIIVIGVAFGLFGLKKSNPGSETISTPHAVDPGSTGSIRSAHPPTTPSNVTSPAIATPKLPPRPTHSPVQANPTNQVADWEDKLETILGSENEERQKVKQLLELFPRISGEGQVEVAQHLSNLVEDSDYESLQKLLLDPKLPEDVLDVLIADILNRPNGVKLPTLLDVARTPNHAKAEEAKDLLELYLEEDYGADWAKWQSSMEQWLKDNPD